MIESTVNILMVDDHPENLLALEAVLASPGYRLIGARSGHEALRRVLQEEFALILLDVQMPELSGFETAKLIKARAKSQDIPIIFITALSQSLDHILQGYAVGAVDYVLKPFDPGVLRKKVSALIDMYRSRQEIVRERESLHQQRLELERQYETLENVVHERTQELVVINRQLQAEIEENRDMHRLIRESEEKYRQLIEQSPETIIVSERNGEHWSFVNDAGLKLLGADKRAQLDGKQPLDYVHPEDRQKFKANLELLQRGKMPHDIEIRFIRLDGETVDVQLKAIPFVYRGELSLHLIVRDITELKRSREIIQQSDKLNMAGELAAGIAHEIRNPLTSLRGFIQLLEHRSEANKVYTDIMLSEIDRINTIVGELLLLSKPSKLSFRPSLLRDMIESVITLLEAQGNLFGVLIRTEIEPGREHLAVNCEENKLKQVLINLLKNAIESMPHGGTVLVRLSGTASEAKIAIVDHGCGIPADRLPRIGQPFYTTKENGTGLGLMISQGIIENHGGVLEIESEVGKGTTVVVSLPSAAGNVPIASCSEDAP